METLKSMINETKIGTLGGTLLSIITVNTTDVANTIAVAAIGAITSFFVSLLIKKLWEKLTKK